MPKIVDLTQAYGMRRFYTERPKRLGLLGTLIASNVLWISVIVVLGSVLLGVTEFANFMASNYMRERTELSQIKNLTAKELAERDMKIARLIAYQSSSPADVLALSTKISTVLNTAPARHREFFERALPEAMQIQINHGIPASAILAMSIYESGYGRSVLAAQYNNFFGIKAFNTWNGPVARDMPTRDLGVLTKANFRAYGSMKEGFQGYANFVRESNRYTKAFQTTSGLEFVRELLRAGYCPDSDYLGNIRRIMERHKLMELDRALEITTDNVVAMKRAAELEFQSDAESQSVIDDSEIITRENMP